MLITEFAYTLYYTIHVILLFITVIITSTFINVWINVNCAYKTCHFDVSVVCVPVVQRVQRVTNNAKAKGSIPIKCMI